MKPGAAYVVSVQGLKNSGKTTVAEALIAALLARGYPTGSVKLTGHARLDLDARGSDSFRHAAAGAEFVLARSETETFLMRRGARDPAPLLELVSREVQFVVCEGCRDSAVGAYVVCLRSPAELEETLRRRGLPRGRVIAFSGVAAAALEPEARSASPPLYDVRRAEAREALVDLLLAAAGGPRPAAGPAGPLSADPHWQPGPPR